MKFPKCQVEGVEDAFRPLIESLSQPFRELCLDVVTNKEFLAWPGAHDKHHTWKGGLAQHTLEVATVADSILNLSARGLDRDVVITACIFHDIGKVQDFTIDNVKTPHHRRIYHVSRSYHEWMKASEAFLNFPVINRGAWVQGKPSPVSYFTDEVRDHVAHCILGHHGQVEWRAVVEPQTPEATLVHLADMASARVLHDCIATK